MQMHYLSHTHKHSQAGLVTHTHTQLICDEPSSEYDIC
jgi:hypothetical protein